MDRRSTKEAASDRVYHAIKAEVVAYAYPEGRRIYLQPIADRLRVSTTPVREALNRLAAEDLVVKAPRKGFIAISLSEERLEGYYELNRLLLAHELEQIDDSRRAGLADFEPVATVLFKLNRRVIRDHGTLAMYTGEVFARIGSLGSNSNVMLEIGRANDNLYFLRTLECQQIEGVQDELKRMCELLQAGQVEELMALLDDYHDTRVELLPRLLEFVRR